MSDSIQVNEKSLVKIYVAIHVLSIVLVEKFDVSVQVSLVKNTVDALCRANVTVSRSYNAITVANALISHRLVLDNLYVFSLYLVL